VVARESGVGARTGGARTASAAEVAALTLASMAAFLLRISSIMSIASAVQDGAKRQVRQKCAVLAVRVVPCLSLLREVTAVGGVSYTCVPVPPSTRSSG
jgi:hypothetical protein